MVVLLTFKLLLWSAPLSHELLRSFVRLGAEHVRAERSVG